METKSPCGLIRNNYLTNTMMKKKKLYYAPEVEELPMYYLDILCESDNTGSTEDYEPINDFTW